MLRDGQLVIGDFELPVCMEQLPASYSLLSPEVCTRAGKTLRNAC